jgi:hypothetical protein
MSVPDLPERPLVGYLTLAFIVVLLGVDQAQSRPIDPYRAPQPVALGSGETPAAAHCTNF